MDFLKEELSRLKERDLHRTLRALSSAPGARVTLDGKSVVNFASNDYLGLSGDERVIAASVDALRRFGAGSTGSRLMGGHLDLHAQLEKELADFKGAEAAAVFPSGYHVNTGLLSALAGPDDVIFLDRLCHASLVDGARLSKARLRVFRHNDPAHLDAALARDSGRGRRWIVTESVFSMDGDAAPLKEIVAIARARGAFIYLDEAHATGVFGSDGGGLAHSLGLQNEIDVRMGTLSKALGGLGGFVAGSRTLVEWIHNRCRSFIYSTALPPASAAAALKALEICRREGDRRARLFALSSRLRAGLGGSSDGEGPIVPFLVGTSAEALRLSGALLDAGVFAPAVRPPTVPQGTARLRFSVTAAHAEADVDRALNALHAAGAPPSRAGTFPNATPTI